MLTDVPRRSFFTEWLRASSVALFLWLAFVSMASAAGAIHQEPDTRSDPNASWPSCGFNCEAGDVSLTQLYLADANGDPLPTCTAGTPVTGYIWGDFYNNTGTDRYAIVLLGDLYINNVFNSSLQTGSVAGVCGGNIIPSGTTSTSLTSLQWTCGDAVDLRNVVVSWDTSDTTCNAFFAAPSCSNRKTKCAASSVPVTVRPLVEANFTAANVCLGDPIQFTNTSAGGVAPMSYNWAFGDGSSSTQASPTHTYASAGSYSVQLNVSDASVPPVSDTTSQSVTVYDYPVADYTATTLHEGDTTLTVGFTNQSTLPNNGCTPTYLWDFGDGATSTAANPEHVFTRRQGPYTVQLTVTTCGCPHTLITQVSAPLSVDLSSFAATQQGIDVLVSWETISEVNNMGFNLYRAASPSGVRQMLGFFPAVYPGSPMGASYSYLDTDVAIGQTYFYWLQDIDDTGVSTYHGPVSITVQSPTAVTLNRMQVDAAPPLRMGWALCAAAAVGGLWLIWGKRRSPRFLR